VPAQFSRSLQENLLTLLCFSHEHCHTVANAVDPNKFDGVYQEIARKATIYIQDQQAPPGTAHLPELLEKELDQSSDMSEAFKRALFNLVESKDEVNARYTLSKLSQFLTIQNLREGIVQAANHLIAETDTSVEEAQAILTATLRNRIACFEPGTTLGSPNLDDLLNKDVSALPTGIRELDYLNLGPTPKELHVFMALLGRGKTWWLMHLGRQALLQRKKVCHITLEVSENNMVKRYLQSLFGISKRGEATTTSTFELDELGRVVSLGQQEVKANLAFTDHDLISNLAKKLELWKPKLEHLIVKEFPTGRLTIPELMAYLDMLESTRHFTPDLLIIDYADLMKVDANNYRLDIGRIYKDLRGLAVERSIAVETASQSNRTGFKARRLSEANVGEDLSKLQTADVVMAYNQTPAEFNVGLARLNVMKARNDQGGFDVLIAQNYALGQFCLRSTKVVKKYWDIMPRPDEETDQGETTK